MVEIIAHRGASREKLENTRAAFVEAIAQQADGVELDIHCTSDGQVVVHHDFHLRDKAGSLVAIAGALASPAAAKAARPTGGVI